MLRQSESFCLTACIYFVIYRNVSFKNTFFLEAQGSHHALINRSVVRRVEVELARAERAHHGVEDAELQRCEGSDHDAPGAQALRAELDDARLLRDVHHALRDGPVTASTGLVHLREQRIRGVRNDRGDDTGNRTAAQAHTRVVE